MEEWAALPEDAPGEFVDGHLTEEEAPDPVHELAVSWLIALFRAWLGAGSGFVFASDVKFVVSASRGRKPDVSGMKTSNDLSRRGVLRLPVTVAAMAIVAIAAAGCRNNEKTTAPAPATAPATPQAPAPIPPAVPRGRTPVRTGVRPSVAVSPRVPHRAAPARNAVAPALAAGLVDTYCVTCHNDRLKTASLSLQGLGLEHVPEQAQIWEKVMRKVRSGEMPPATVRNRPEPAAAASLVNYLETTIDRAAVTDPNPGRPTVHRLNRAEYSNAIRDLLAVDVKPGDWLPVDDSGYGFDNIAAVLSSSPALLERYMTAARRVSRLAVGDVTVKPADQIYDAKRDPLKGVRNEQLNDDLPFDSRAGLSVTHYFPVDAEYVFKIRFLGVQPTGEEEETDPYQARLPVKAGLQTVGVTSPRENAKAESDVPAGRGGGAGGRGSASQVPYPVDLRLDGRRVKRFDVPGGTAPDVSKLIIAGPYNPTGRGDTPSRATIFICRPATANDQPACARRIFSHLARRAFRRPVTAADIQPLYALYEKGRGAGGDFEAGIQNALQALLVSPEFLFRIEQDPRSVSEKWEHAPSRPAPPAKTPKIRSMTARAARLPGARSVLFGRAPGRLQRPFQQAAAAYPISGLDLASRLSFFLWSTIPDDELLDLAERGRLKDPLVLQQQVRRMLDDPRADALISNFAGQWLHLRNVDTVKPDPVAFPFDEALRQAFMTETELFVRSIFREDRSLLDLLSADHTFVNERLATHYGIPNVYGSQFRRVVVTDPNRRGLLGQGSILTVTSYPNRTSVVQRGKWILENLLGTPPPPPPNVPELKAAANGKRLTMREQMQAHRANATCAACHARMDPIGFALENFDGIGKWRNEDGGAAIDASGTLPDGTAFQGPAGLTQLLLTKYRDDFVRTVTEKLLTYALGRGVEYYDNPAIRSIARAAALDNYRISSLILAIVNSTPFQMRRATDS